MMDDASPGAMTHPNRRLLSAGDLRCLLDLGYRFGGAAGFADLAQAAVDEIPMLLGKDCWAAINAFGADGTFLGAHVSASHREIYSHEVYGAVINERMSTDHPLVVHAGLLTGGPQLPVQIRDFETGRGFRHSGLYHDAYRHLETRHQACQWLNVSQEGFSMLGLNRRKVPFTSREMAMIGELRNLLVMAEARLRQVETALRYAETMGEGSPVCGWVEIDIRRWIPLRMAGPAEGWLAALRRSDESVHCIPDAVRKAATTSGGTAHLACPAIPEPGLEATAFQGIIPGRAMVVLRRPLTRATNFTCESLTRREREVLSLAGTGRSRGEVALQLGIAKRTVDKHLEHAYAKLGASDRVEALLKAEFRTH